MGNIDDESKIEIAEVKTKRESVDSEGERSEKTVFHGLFASIELKDYIPINIKIH